MAGFTTANNEHLIRSQIWDTDLQRVFSENLMGNRYVRMIPYWGGGTLNMPSLGQARTRDYVEGSQVQYDAMDTGNFTFLPTEYKSSATYITNKMKQDTFYMNELVSSFVPEQAQALAVAMEVSAFAAGPEGQTLANTNSINGASHRLVGSGTNETISVIDFQKARYALQKANVPLSNLIAIVDPSVEYALATQTNLVNFSNNPRWEGIIRTGVGGGDTGMKFIVNIFGFDVYTSNFLKVNTASETIGGVTAAAGVNNLFFSAASPRTLPVIGTVMQSPKVDSAYNHDFQREEYVTTCRFDHKLRNPDCLVTIVTDTDQV